MMGSVFGLTAGMSPEPLLKLVISETLKHNRSEGIKVSLSPLFTDQKGIIANFLNPHPYVFWLTIGTPIAFKAYETGLSTAILYFLSFYVFLIGSKIGIALIVEKSKSFLKNNAYVWIMRFLGATLIVFAAIMFYDGFKIIQNI